MNISGQTDVSISGRGDVVTYEGFSPDLYHTFIPHIIHSYYTLYYIYKKLFKKRIKDKGRKKSGRPYHTYITPL